MHLNFNKTRRISDNMLKAYVNIPRLLVFCTLSIHCWFSITSDLPPENAVQKIPKLFHTVWMNFGRGDEPFPEYKANIEKLMKMHPGWEIKNWTEKEIDDLIKNEYPQYYPTFISYDVKIKKHDFCRPIILHKYGGFYLDHDSTPLRNVEPLLKSYDVVMANEMPDSFYPINGIMASIPKHNFWLYYLDSMCRPGESKKWVLSATGPWKLKPTMREYEQLHSTDGMKLYNNSFFCPIHSNDKTTAKGLSDEELRIKFPNVYILQEFKSTWK